MSKEAIGTDAGEQGSGNVFAAARELDDGLSRLSGSLGDLVRCCDALAPRKPQETDPEVERTSALHQITEVAVEAIRPLALFLQGIDPAVSDIPASSTDLEAGKLPMESFWALDTAQSLAGDGCRKMSALFEGSQPETGTPDALFQVDDALVISYLAVAAFYNGYTDGAPFPEPDALTAIRRMTEAAYGAALDAEREARRAYEGALHASRARKEEMAQA